MMGVELWYCATVLLWYCGILLLWYYGIVVFYVVFWYYGIVVKGKGEEMGVALHWRHPSPSGSHTCPTVALALIYRLYWIETIWRVSAPEPEDELNSLDPFLKMLKRFLRQDLLPIPRIDCKLIYIVGQEDHP